MSQISKIDLRSVNCTTAMHKHHNSSITFCSHVSQPKHMMIGCRLTLVTCQYPFCITCFLGKGRAEQVDQGRGGGLCNALCMLCKSPIIVTLECRYSSLRTNLPRQIMSFSDFPFIPEVMGDHSHDSRRFPSHTEVQAWLEVFAAKFQLRQHIKFNSQIVSLRPITSAAVHSNSALPASVKTAPKWKLTVQAAASKHAAQHAEQALHATAANGAKSQAKPADSAASPPTTNHDSLAADIGASSEASSDPAEADHSASHHSDSHGLDSRHDCTKHHYSRHDSTANGCSSRSAGQHTHAHSSHTEPDSEQQDSAESECTAESHLGPSGCTEYTFDAVVVCVGNYHQPNLPEIKGMDDFRGLQMHAHNYRSSSMFAGMRVIVVGASFSGACCSLVSIMPVSGTHQLTLPKCLFHVHTSVTALSASCQSLVLFK